MGKWEVWCIGNSGPLPYDHAVRFKSPMLPSANTEDNHLSLGGTTCAFTEEDANTIAEILNKQQEAATAYCEGLVRSIKEEETNHVK